MIVVDASARGEKRGMQCRCFLICSHHHLFHDARFEASTILTRPENNAPHPFIFDGAQRADMVILKV